MAVPKRGQSDILLRHIDVRLPGVALVLHCLMLSLDSHVSLLKLIDEFSLRSQIFPEHAILNLKIGDIPFALELEAIDFFFLPVDG